MGCVTTRITMQSATMMVETVLEGVVVEVEEEVLKTFYGFVFGIKSKLLFFIGNTIIALFCSFHFFKIATLCMKGKTECCKC